MFKQKNRKTLLSSLLVVLSCMTGLAMAGDGCRLKIPEAMFSKLQFVALTEESEQLEVGSQQVEIDAAMAWRTEVEELEWAEIRPNTIDRKWLAPDYMPEGDLAVAKGVADSSKTAMHVAIDQYIIPRLEAKSRRGLALDSPWKVGVARRRLLLELRRNPSLIVDEFSQSFSKRVGDETHEAFAREALLLDLSDKHMDKFARSIHRDIHQIEDVRSAAFGFAGISVFVILFVCWIVYRFLNRVTRGYYVWPLRFAATAMLLVSLGLAAGITISILNAI